MHSDDGGSTPSVSTMNYLEFREKYAAHLSNCKRCHLRLEHVPCDCPLGGRVFHFAEYFTIQRCSVARELCEGSFPMKKKAKANKVKLVKELARERMGQPKPSRVDKDKRAKNWKERCQEEIDASWEEEYLLMLPMYYENTY